jgi:hypothetical protein
VTAVKDVTVHLVICDSDDIEHVTFETSVRKLFTITFQFTQTKLISTAYFYISISNKLIIIIIIIIIK